MRRKQCKRCGSAVNNLQEHMKECNEIYTCLRCGKEYKTKQTLRTHKKTHEEEDIYKCPNCVKKYYNLHSLNRHLTKCATATIKVEASSPAFGSAISPHSRTFQTEIERRHERSPSSPSHHLQAALSPFDVPEVEDVIKLEKADVDLDDCDDEVWGGAAHCSDNEAAAGVHHFAQTQSTAQSTSSLSREQQLQLELGLQAERIKELENMLESSEMERVKLERQLELMKRNEIAESFDLPVKLEDDAELEFQKIME